MSGPPPLAEQLSFLTGEFTGTERVHATQWTASGEGQARVLGRLELDRGVVLQSQTQERDGAVAFSAINVFMLDPAGGDVLLYSFDSVGYPPDPPSRGTWIGEDLVLVRATPRGESRVVYTPTTGGYRWSKQFRAPGVEEWSPVVEGQLAGPGT